MGADRPNVLTQIDGTGIMRDEQNLLERPSKRARREDENELEGHRFQLLDLLETLQRRGHWQDVDGGEISCEPFLHLTKNQTIFANKKVLVHVARTTREMKDW